MKGRDLIKLLEPYLDTDIVLWDTSDPSEWHPDFVGGAEVLEVVEHESEGIRLLSTHGEAGKPLTVLCLKTADSHDRVARIQLEREEETRKAKVKEWVSRSRLDEKLDAVLAEGGQS